MKYKTVDIPRPEWCQIGTVVKIKQLEGEWAISGISPGGYIYVRGLLPSFCVEMVTPVPAWEPTPGEYCAFWGDDAFFTIECFKGFSGRMFCSDRMSYWDHVARITGVDCACSVEELKKRTEWL